MKSFHLQTEGGSSSLFLAMRFLSTVVFFCVALNLAGQVNFCVLIKNKTTKTPLPYATVNLPELKRNGISDANGKICFTNLPHGQFTLQISFTGFKTFISTIILPDSIQEYEVALEEITYEIPEFVVYGENNSSPEKTANNISTISTSTMRNNGALNLSDGIAQLPGVSQLSTGAGISKPVIRGLYGNRIQTVLLGLRFDNQQWQDEHGLGLSDVGIDRVEIIKGPASLLYGSEAMGGVLNIIEEKPAAINRLQSDFSSRYFSNTHGVASDFGIKKSNEKFNWRIRAGLESHADYTDGNNERVLNSRFGGYYAKAGLGFNSRKWITNNTYFFALSNYGFLMDPIQLFDPPDNRNSRSFDRPHHTVLLNILSSQNTFFFKRSKLKINAGFCSNNRQEQEGGNKISLDMLLSTSLLNALYTRQISKKTELSIGTQDFYQSNINQGSRVIIPNARQIESSVYVYTKSSFSHLVIEGGLRYDWRYIKTLFTDPINTNPNASVGKNITTISKSYDALNGSLGISLFDENHWNFKCNVSSGYRPGNLAELSSNGLHEGTVRYEIGNPDLKIEQNFCLDALLSYSTSNFLLSGSVYSNRFINYIYLAPTSTEFIGFQIFEYQQQNALLTGTEVSLNIHPKALKFMEWNSAYSITIGKTDDGAYLPYIPAGKINSNLKIKFGKKMKSAFVQPGIIYVFEQNRIAELETPTDDYYLINVAAGMESTIKHHLLQLSISANNLLNTTYYDHLSRFKYFGIYNIGRNISLNLKLVFNQN